MARYILCVSLYDVLPFHSPSRPAPTKKGSSILPSPYLVPGDQGRQDFSKASDQCLKKVDLLLLFGEGAWGGRRSEADKASSWSRGPVHDAAL